MFSFLWICFFLDCFVVTGNKFVDHVFHMCLLNLPYWMVHSQMDLVNWLFRVDKICLRSRLILVRIEHLLYSNYVIHAGEIGWIVLLGLIVGFVFWSFSDSSFELWAIKNLYILYGIKKVKRSKNIDIFSQKDWKNFHTTYKQREWEN